MPLAAFVIVGEEKHTGTQDPARGASRARLAAGVRDWLHDWGCKCQHLVCIQTPEITNW